MNSIVERLRQHALPDPHDEREVMHAPLLREAAERIKELERKCDYWRDHYKDLRQRIYKAMIAAAPKPEEMK